MRPLQALLLCLRFCLCCLLLVGLGLTSREAPSLIKPVPLATAKKLIQSWRQSAPRKLAW